MKFKSQFLITETRSIPTNWEIVELQEISEVIDSLHQTPQYSSIGYPMVRASDIKSGDLNLKNTLKVSKEVFIEFTRKYHPSKNDIVMSRVGTYFPNSFIETEEPFCLGQNTVLFHPLIDPRFLYYALNSRFVQQQIQEELVGSGGQKTISLEDIRELIILKPKNNSEIQDISRKISLLDYRIVNLQNQNQILERIIQAIFKSWFIDFDGQKEFADSELGEIPNGWEVKTVGDIGKIITGKTPPTKDQDNFGIDYPFITIPDMHDSVFVINAKRHVSEKGKNRFESFILPSLSICVSCIATPGLVSFNIKPSMTNQQINSIICKPEISPFFVYLLMKNKKDEIVNLAGGGTAAPNLNKRDFCLMKIIIPDNILLKKFHKLVEPLFDMIKNNLLSIYSLDQIRDSLLPKLMSGEIRV